VLANITAINWLLLRLGRNK